MFRKILSLVLVGLLFNAAGASSVYACSKEEKEAHFAERVREGISRLGTGAEARVEVKLRNKMKLKGYVGEANTEYFTVVDADGGATRIAYPQVKQVKGNNLSEGIKVAIGLGALILLVVILLSGDNS